MDAGTRLHLILLAGGSGSRAGSGRGTPPKQFCVTGRGPLFSISLRAFLDLDPGTGFAVAGVTMTVPEAWRENAVQGLGEIFDSSGSLPWQLAPAGETRTASAWNALQVLASGYAAGREGPAPQAGDLVAVHDAARPFATTDLITRLASAAAAHGAAVPGIPVPDTIVRTSETSDAVAPAVYLKRELLQAVQTPQVFRWDILHEAHWVAAAEGLDFTDDGGLLAGQGHHPMVVPGEAGNWKVTTEADLRQAVELLK